MPDIYEIKAPDGSTLEVESDKPPTRTDALKAIRAYGDHLASQAQQRAQEAGSPFAAPSMENVGRFIGGAAEVLNPLNIVKAGANLVMHPIDTIGQMAGAQLEQGKQAVAKAQEPGFLNKVEAVGHGMAAVTPIIGPMAAKAGEDIAAGDVAGGLGRGAGLLAPIAAKRVIEARTAQNPRAAEMLTRGAEEQVSQKVLAPGNPKYRGRAAAIAPEVLARKLSGGREELRQAAVEGMDDAGARIDQATQAAGGTQAKVSAMPIIARLQQRVHDLSDSSGSPLSDAAAIRIGLLKEKMIQVRALAKGGAVTYEDLKKIRDENYRIADEADAYIKQGNNTLADPAWAARETGGAIRQTFADRSPGAAMANADYTFWKTLNDVLDPVLGRPKVTAPTQGVTGGSRVTGAFAGSLFGGKAGAFIGGTVIPWLHEHVATPKWQLADAQSKLKLADAIRRGDIGSMKAWMVKIEKGSAATSPNESQTQPSAGAQAPSIP